MNNEPYIEQCRVHELRIKQCRSSLLSRRDMIVDDIREAFKDVNRKGGVSLAEVEPLDAGASEQACKRIRATQRDKHWSEVNLRKHDPCGSGICFLDPIGFRYHLPAYMIDRLTIGNCAIDQCPSDDWMGQETVIYRLCDNSKNGQKHHGLLNNEQRTCVAKLLALEVELLTTLIFEGIHDECYSALKNYWLPHLPHENQNHLESIWPGMFD